MPIVSVARDVPVPVRYRSHTWIPPRLSSLLYSSFCYLAAAGTAADAGTKRGRRWYKTRLRADRNQLARLMNTLTKDDLVIMTRLDRLAHSTRDLVSGNLRSNAGRLERLGFECGVSNRN